MSKLIQAAAAAVFLQYPEVNEVYVTEDGNGWLPANKHLAKTHAIRIGSAVHTVKRDGTEVDERTELEQHADAEAKAQDKKLAKEEADKADPDAKEDGDNVDADKVAADKAAADKVAADKAAADKAAADTKGKKGKGK